MEPGHRHEQSSPNDGWGTSRIARPWGDQIGGKGRSVPNGSLIDTGYTNTSILRRRRRRRTALGWIYIYIGGSAPYLSLGFSSDPLLHIPRLSRKTCWQSPSKHFTVISLSCSRPRFCGADLAHLLRTSPHLTRARNL